MHTYQIQKATTDVSIELRIIDSTDGTPETGVVWNTSGIDLQYRRDGAVSTAITEATLAALTTAHTDGGFLHIGNGVYRFDLPDAACATGVDKVTVHGTVTGMVVIGCVIQLVSYDPFDAVRLGLTALPNAAADAAGGLPISDAGGLDLDAKVGALTFTVANEVDSNVITKTGFSLAATGLDAIVSTATGMVEIAKAIWDRVLTGATHNIATSAGRRLRGIQEFQGYEGGAIWIDTVNGTAGTVDYENGTVENPVDTWADALTLNTSLSFDKFMVKDGSAITLSANSDNYHIIGAGASTLALNGQSVIGVTIESCAVSGVMAGIGTTQRFLSCSMGATSLIKGTHVHGSAITATQTIVEAGDIFYDDCHSGIAGTDTWTLDFGAAIGNTNFNLRHYSGGIQLENMGDTGTDTASIEGNGQVIEGTCTGGTVAIRGNFTVSGITNLTLSDDARFDSVQLVDDNWDELLTGATHNISTSAGRIVRETREVNVYTGRIWIDTVNGAAGTTDYENGTVDNPVDSIADAVTLSTSLGINRFEIAPGSSLTLASSFTNYVFNGEGWTLALGGQAVSGTIFHGATVSGTCTGANPPEFSQCVINTVTAPPCHFRQSNLAATITAGAAGDFFFDGCHSAVAGTGTPTFDFGGLIGNTGVNFRHYSGGIQVENMGDTGTDTMSLEGFGQFIEGTCTGGTVAIRGNFTTSGVTNLTLSDDARIDIDNIWTATDRTLTDGIQKNAIFNNLEFLMVDDTDHVTPKVSLTVTGQRSIDGGAFANVTGTIAEVSNGIYQIDLSAADTNGDVITYRFSGTDADDRFLTITTS